MAAIGLPIASTLISDPYSLCACSGVIAPICSTDTSIASFVGVDTLTLVAVRPGNAETFSAGATFISSSSTLGATSGGATTTPGTIPGTPTTIGAIGTTAFSATSVVTATFGSVTAGLDFATSGQTTLAGLSAVATPVLAAVAAPDTGDSGATLGCSLT